MTQKRNRDEFISIKFAAPAHHAALKTNPTVALCGAGKGKDATPTGSYIGCARCLKIMKAI